MPGYNVVILLYVALSIWQNTYLGSVKFKRPFENFSRDDLHDSLIFDNSLVWNRRDQQFLSTIKSRHSPQNATSYIENPIKSTILIYLIEILSENGILVVWIIRFCQAIFINRTISRTCA